MSPSGVGLQTRYMIEAMLKTGKYQFISLGGAMQHEDYRSSKTEEYGDDWVIHPVDGYGTQDQIRSIVRNSKPDILWFMTDPRFYEWLWDIENEIRAQIPMVYYHVWDNYPYPDFNRSSYLSNDYIACISKVTHDIIQTVVPEVESIYLPHSVDANIFKPFSETDINALRRDNFPEERDKTIFFWNNRNARRKQTGSVVFWFKEFLDQVGHDKAKLLMHTDPFDMHGQNLYAVMENLGLSSAQFQISQEKLPPEQLAALYNMADCTVNIADAEGFGLATFESLSCGTPIIVNMTGGLQEQVTDGEEWFGIGIEPASKAVIGSQEVPYIYEDRVSKKDFINALLKIHNMTREERRELGLKGLAHVKKNYSYDQFCKSWDEVLTHIHEKYGSWETRKNYKNWRLREIP